MQVLVVEDEPVMASLLQSALKDEGYHVSLAGRGDEAVSVARSSAFDVIVLDLMLPGMNGFEVAQALRREHIQTPILVLTARDTAADIVRALDGGADDYVQKPFALDVFLARVRAVARRGEIPQPVCYSAGSLQVNLSSRAVLRNGHELALTPREFSLLEVLIKNKGRVLPRTRLIEAVWGSDAEVEDNTLDAFIRLLRHKIEMSGEAKLIRTIRGIGYSLQESAW